MRITNGYGKCGWQMWMAKVNEKYGWQMWMANEEGKCEWQMRMANVVIPSKLVELTVGEYDGLADDIASGGRDANANTRRFCEANS